MRDIIFRGKRIDISEWIYGDLVRDNIGGVYVFPNDAKGLYPEYKVNPETVGQYIGLTDKKGAKIFEGDIIRSYGSLGDVIIHTVNWDEKEAYYKIYNEYGSPCGHINQQWIEDFDKEVIGNIHDNPELLKGGEE